MASHDGASLLWDVCGGGAKQTMKLLSLCNLPPHPPDSHAHVVTKSTKSPITEVFLAPPPLPE